MRTYEVKFAGDDREAAERAVRRKLGMDLPQTSLIAWYDRGKHTGGPSEPCADETDKCAFDYARSHGASIRVSVNDGVYDFFYAVAPPDVVELDPTAALQVHQNIPIDDSENQQGG